MGFESDYSYTASLLDTGSMMMQKTTILPRSHISLSSSSLKTAGTTMQPSAMKKINVILRSIVLLVTLLIAPSRIDAFIPAGGTSARSQRFDNASRQTPKSIHFGWLENFFEPGKSSSSSSREVQYPEQYPATYELNNVELEEDARCLEAKLMRPLLKNTQLESRALELVYSAEKNGWSPNSFHSSVDGRGAAVVLAKTREGRICGGYNPKGWASLGGARPSVAAFLFYERAPGNFQKLQKVGGGGLACARDDPGFGICFGADGLVIGLQPGRERKAQSKLGPYFERGPDELSSIFGGATDLTELKVLVGKYEPGEEIPYSGGVLDMTSG